uniref:PiggyBac transposable element-derived protein domain-containing protein n=1 Tax=Hippocampus comes TaxID=109280 RepID=A0A3Q2YJ73_HIPCM
MRTEEPLSSSLQRDKTEKLPRSSSRLQAKAKEPPKILRSQNRPFEESLATSTWQRVESEVPLTEPEFVKNKDRVFKQSKRPATPSLPKHMIYRANAAECVKQSCPDPMTIFLIMYQPTLREITIEMSNLFSIQTKARQLNMGMDELLTFYGILLASVYSTVPRRHMHWSSDTDVHNLCISNAMRRNRFDEIMASTHFVDNTKITEDPFFKVRPIFTELNKSYKVMPYPECLSVDKSMTGYCRRNGCKQFMKGKPIRFGYKIWSLASSSGYMHHMEPYGVRQGPSVVLGLAEQGEVPPGFKFYHDNLFTSLSLLDEMTKRGCGSCGMMRENQLFDVPFKPKSEFMKLHRGTSEILMQTEKLLVHWKDNNVLTTAPCTGEQYTETVVKRWNKERHDFNQVHQSQCIKQYYEHMGGVDLRDQQVSRYSITIRSKKWWWPMFSWSLSFSLCFTFDAHLIIILHVLSTVYPVSCNYYAAYHI